MRFAALRSKVLPFVCMVALGTSLVPATADEIAQIGRDMITKNGDAVVTLQLVIKAKMSMEGEEGRKEESKSEATGVVVDPSGLVVTSLTQTDPSETINRMMAGEGSGFKFSTEISDLKIRLANGKELPAKVVLRDKDLDLAFVRPLQKPEVPLAAVDLSKQGTPAILDQILVMSRMGTVASRQLAVGVNRIQAIVEKPRTFYVATLEGSGDLGAPVFATDGSVVGMVVLRSLPGRSSGSMGMFGGAGDMGMLPIIVPASDILTAAKQAPESAAAVKAELTTEKTPTPAPKPAAKPAKPGNKK